MTSPLPPDTRAPGQAGHIGDHNELTDAVAALQNQVQGILTSGLTTTGSIDIAQAGQGLNIAEGANGRQGAVVLVAGQAVVNNTTVTAHTRIQTTGQGDGGTPGWTRVSTRTPGVSFTIVSSSATDTSTVAYAMSEPG